MADTAASPQAPASTGSGAAHSKKTAAAAAASSGGGQKKAKNTKSKPSHPPTSEMVNSAIKNLKERGGSSLQAIKKYVSANYKVDAEKLSPFIKKYLKSAVASGGLVQTKGKGASGSFKLSSGAAAAANKQHQIDKTAAAASKPKATRKPAGAAAKAKSVGKKSPASGKTKAGGGATEKKSPIASKAKSKAQGEKKIPKSPKSPSKAKRSNKGPTKKPKAPKPKRAKPTGVASPAKGSGKKAAASGAAGKKK